MKRAGAMFVALVLGCAPPPIPDLDDEGDEAFQESDEKPLADCADSAEVRFSEHIEPILLARCARCHTATGGAGDLDLASLDARQNLLEGQTRCNGSLHRVVPGDPASSLLIRKLAGDPTLPVLCQGAMPQGARGPLQIKAPVCFKLIEEWIRQGARDD